MTTLKLEEKLLPIARYLNSLRDFIGIRPRLGHFRAATRLYRRLFLRRPARAHGAVVFGECAVYSYDDGGFAFNARGNGNDVGLLEIGFGDAAQFFGIEAVERFAKEFMLR